MMIFFYTEFLMRIAWKLWAPSALAKKIVIYKGRLSREGCNTNFRSDAIDSMYNFWMCYFLCKMYLCSVAGHRNENLPSCLISYPNLPNIWKEGWCDLFSYGVQCTSFVLQSLPVSTNEKWVQAPCRLVLSKNFGPGGPYLNILARLMIK